MKSLSERLNIEKPWINSCILGSIDDTYQPSLKDDFYVAKNHKWLKTAKPRKGHCSISSFDELQHIIDDRIKNLMINDSINTNDAKIIRKYYTALMDFNTRENENFMRFKKYLDIIQDIKTIDDLTHYLTRTDLHTLERGNIVSIQLGFDIKESDVYNVNIYPFALILGDSAEYKNLTENGRKNKELNDKIVTYVLKRFGYSDEFIKRMIDLEFEFDKLNAPYISTYEYCSRDEYIRESYNPITLEELKKLSPNLPIIDILKVLHFDHSKLINILEPKWLERINELYTEENLEMIKASMFNNVATSFIWYIDKDSLDTYVKYYNERYGVTESLPYDEYFALSVKNMFSVCVSKTYIAKYIDTNIKSEIEELIRKIISYYKKILDNQEWLSNETKLKAIEKLDALKIFAVYPDKWNDYSDFSIDDFDNLWEMRKHIEDYKFKKFNIDRINTKRDPEKWINNITSVNAYNSLLQNAIIIIAAILDGVFYNKNMSVEEKLGGIGFIIAHEISHSFDTNGAQFDKNGKFNNWWSKDDLNTFKERSKKIINYFDKMILSEDGTPYKGIIVQTEFTADITGMKCILNIAKEYKDFNYDKFFTSFAKIWRYIATSEAIESLIKTDEHGISCLRVNAVLQQFDEFYKTYNINENDKMYLAPENRISIW